MSKLRYWQIHPPKGPAHPFWKGGIKKSNGYILIKKPEHPFSYCNGYVPEHRLVMEEKLGRYLTKQEDIHHINGNRSDNRIENLVIITRYHHSQIHNGKKKAKFSKLDDKNFLISEHIDKKTPINAIARELNCSYTAVTNALSRHNITLIDRRTDCHFPELCNKVWLADALKELSTRKLASLLGCSQSLVRFHQMRHGIVAPRKPNGK